MQPKEIEAMSKVDEALKALTDDELRLVFHWLDGKYRKKLGVNSSPPATPPALRAPKAEDDKIVDDLPAYFAKASAKNGVERTLVVAGYLQNQKQDKEDLTGFEINSQLKDLGYPAANITDVLESLGKKNPKLIIQTRKDGKGAQARKRYRVTVEGFNFINKLMSPEGEN